jgi:hypothetical protein
MLIHLQFPFADLRAFADVERLPVPSWPAPRPKQFVRFLGMINTRRKGGVEGIGEGSVCNAKRVFRYGEGGPLSTHFKAPDGRTHLVNFERSFRRFTSDGIAVCKLDVGFFSNGNASVDDNSEHSIPFRSLIDKLLTLVVNARSYSPHAVGAWNSTQTPIRLAEIGDHLAKQYSSANARQLSDQIPQSTLCLPGRPLIVIESYERLLFAPEERPHRVKTIRDQLYTINYWLHPLDKHDFIPVWAIRYSSKSQFTKRRALRIHIQRLYAECEVFALVMDAVSTHTIDPMPRGRVSGVLQQYFDDAIDRLNSAANKASDALGMTSNDHDVVLMFDSMVRPGEREALLSRFKVLDVRGNLRRKTNAFLQTMESRPLSSTEMFIIILG